eukprot:CAMPEP_0116878038 /NCGR_PEP_ID=MMETSP0463-20121206/9785_1 /TAXON_ID=181622 /ORGANISM="Strombidinopsis sp, Strain SopsisLIS2011" /LENGTH=62 /DNA_ID=CAMNT_0004525853 /DNA_START=1312 /DNA_END=1500 /DNA_ORIENTATION=+
MDPSDITVPIVLVNSLSDNLSNVNDVEKLVRVLGGVTQVVNDEDLYQQGDDHLLRDQENASA